MKGSLGKSFILSVLVQGSGAPLAFIASIIVARFLGPDGFGHYMTLLSIAYLVGGVAVLGCDFLLVREIASENNVNDNVNAISSWSIRRVFIASFAGGGVVFCWLFFFDSSSAYSVVEIVLACLLVLFSASAIIVYGILRGFGFVVLSQALSDPIRNVTLLILLVALSWFDLISSEAVIMIQVGTFVFVTFFGWRFLRIKLGILPLNYYLMPTQKVVCIVQRKVSSWKISSWHFFIGSAGILTLSKLDIVIVNYLSNAVNAGVYSAGVRIGLMVAVIGLAGQLWLQSKVAKKFSCGEIDELMGLLGKSSLFIGGGTLVVSIGVFFFANYIVSFLGEGFDNSADVLRWVCLGYVFWAISLPMLVFLQMSGEEALVARFLWLQVFINLFLNISLVPSLGAIGGAYAWSIGMVVTALLCLWYGRKKLKSDILTFNSLGRS